MLIRLLGFPAELQPFFKGTHTSFDPCASIADGFIRWAQKRLTELTQPDLIVIYVHALFLKQSFRQEYEGIEVLKHLRLTTADSVLAFNEKKGQPEKKVKTGFEAWRKCHVVLVSWDTAGTIIRRNPGNSIIFSSGVTFVHTLDAIERLSDQNELLALAKEKADLADPFLMAAIRADYRPPDSEHGISNWWGAWRLLRAVEKDDAQMPLPVRRNLASLSSKQALFLNAREDPTIPQADPRLQRTGLSRSSMSKLRDLVSETKPRICYVDDEAHLGWEHAFRTLLYGEQDSSHFKTVRLSEGRVARTMTEVSNDIRAEAPNLLIMDLRLAGKDEARKPPKETTGALLLETIRRDDRGLPVLLLTASNKARTMQDMLELGADAYWMKEGIGEHAPSYVSENPAAELTRLLRTLLREDWQFLLRFDRAEKELRSAFKAGHCWWGDKRNWTAVPWGKAPKHASVNAPTATSLNIDDAEKVFSILSEMGAIYRELLSLDLLTYSGKKRTNTSNDLWLRGITVHAARVIEAVHRFDAIETQAKSSNPRLPLHIPSVIRDRGDELGQVLYNQRNAAAHYKPDNQFTLTDTRKLLGTLCAWLRLDPGSYALRLRWGERPDSEDSLREALARYVTFDQSLIGKLSILMFAEYPWKDEPRCLQLLASDKLVDFRTEEGLRIGPDILMNIVDLEEGPRAALALQCFQPFAKDRKVQEALQQRWSDGKTSSRLRCHLIWRIADDPDLTAEYKTELRSWLFDNFDAWTLGVGEFFEGTPGEILASTQKKLLAGSGYPEHKKWIPLCCVPVSSDMPEARRLLSSLSSADPFVEATRTAVLDRFFK
jgi:CheY-like chemotaxis protein